MFGEKIARGDSHSQSPKYEAVLRTRKRKDGKETLLFACKATERSSSAKHRRAQGQQRTHHVEDTERPAPKPQSERRLRGKQKPKSTFHFEAGVLNYGGRKAKGGYLLQVAAAQKDKPSIEWSAANEPPWHGPKHDEMPFAKGVWNIGPYQLSVSFAIRSGGEPPSACEHDSSSGEERFVDTEVESAQEFG